VLRSPHRLLFPRLPSPSSPSLSSQQTDSSPQVIAGASSGPAPAALPCAEGSRAGRRTPGGVSAERGRGAEPRPSPCAHAAGDAAQGTVGCWCCERTLPGHGQLFIPHHPQVLLIRAALHPFIPQPVSIAGLAPTQAQDPALGLVEPHMFHTGPLLQLVQVPLDAIPSLRLVNHTLSLVSSANVLRVHLVHCILSHEKHESLIIVGETMDHLRCSTSGADASIPQSVTCLLHKQVFISKYFLSFLPHGTTSKGH